MIHGLMRLQGIAFKHPAWLVAVILLSQAGSGCGIIPPGGPFPPPADERTVIVSEASETMLRPLMVEEPQEERWRDIGDGLYTDRFREDFDYHDGVHSRAQVSWEEIAPTLTGTLSAEGLKPWFAYQVKLVGAVPVAGPREADNMDGAKQWSSWQLGRIGRWWCEDCHWNLTDSELRVHLSNEHTVRGYILFDWFVTDGSGAAQHPFALDSSLHVLWRVDQRERGPRDTGPRWYEVRRTPEVFGTEFANTVHRFGIFGEWEPDRPRPREARLPAGEYSVKFNLTEESFHANIDEARELAGGGFWALVLESDLDFEVRSTSRPSCLDCLPPPD